MEGFGSGGQKQPGMTTYGATKRAVTYLTESLVKETKGSPVKVGFLSPGIVATDLLVDDYDGQPEAFEKARKIFNILGDRVETVTPWLADRLLAAEKHGARVAWLTAAQGVRPVRDRGLPQARHLPGRLDARPGRGPRLMAIDPCTEYGLALALEDFVPVVLAGAGAIVLASAAGRRVPELRVPALVGGLLITAGGLSKATWKVLVASEPCRNVELLEQLLFPCLAFGFALLAWAVVGARRGSAAGVGAVRRGARARDRRRRRGRGDLAAARRRRDRRDHDGRGRCPMGVGPGRPPHDRAVRLVRRRYSRAATPGRTAGAVSDTPVGRAAHQHRGPALLPAGRARASGPSHT